MSNFTNDQWQEAIVQLANNGVTVAPANDVQASGTIAGTSAVTVTFGTGVASWTVDISGTVGAGSVLQFEYLVNSTWYSAFGVVVGSNSDVAVSSVTLASVAVSYQGNAAGFQQFRVRCSSYNGTDSLTIKIIGSVATDGGFVSKSLPPGSNLIGGVNVSQMGGIATQMSNADGVNSLNIIEHVLGVWAAGGPVLASGLPSLLSIDRLRSIEAKKPTAVTITSTTVGDAQLTCTAGAMQLVAPGQKVQLSGSGVTEDVFVADSPTYTPSTSATSIPLKSPVVNTGQTTAKFDTFDARGPNGNAMLPDGVLPFAPVHEDITQRGSFYNLVSGSADAQSAAFYPELCMGVFNGNNTDRMRGNTDNISLFASAARTTTQTGADQTNFNGRGVIVTLDVTVPGTGSITLEIDMKDPVSGKYIALLTGAAVTTQVTNVYTVYPGAPATANVSANSPLPRTWRVKITANNANSVTYSCGASVIL